MKDLFSDRFQMLKRAKARWGLLNCSWLCQNAQHCTAVLWAQLFSSFFFLAAVGAPASNGLLHCFAQLPGGVGYAATTAVSSGWSWGAGCQNLCVNLCILLNVKWFKCQQMHAFNSPPHSRLMCCLALFCGVLSYVSFCCMLPLFHPYFVLDCRCNRPPLYVLSIVLTPNGVCLHSHFFGVFVYCGVSEHCPGFRASNSSKPLGAILSFHIL